MEYRFVMHRRASKQLGKLPTELDERTRRKLREMVTDEFRDLMDYDVDAISGVEYEIYRTRISGHRVFFPSKIKSSASSTSTNATARTGDWRRSTNEPTSSSSESHYEHGERPTPNTAGSKRQQRKGVAVGTAAFTDRYVPA